jgi:hypothetical protein
VADSDGDESWLWPAAAHRWMSSAVVVRATGCSGTTTRVELGNRGMTDIFPASDIRDEYGTPLVGHWCPPRGRLWQHGIKSGTVGLMYCTFA